MLTDLLSLLLVGLFVAKGLQRPYVALVGVLWIDLYQPQLLSHSFLFEQPLSLIMNIFFLISLVLNFSKIERPPTLLYVVIVPALMVWITLTTYNAEFPDAAWPRHDVAVKMLLFTYSIPFILKSRKQLELFLWILIASMSYFVLSAGMKSLMNGGGYGLDLVSDSGTVLWSEGSTLATQAICLLPILYYAGRYSLLAGEYRPLRPLLLVVAFASLMVLIGTEARTGLIALAALVFLTLFSSRSKLKAIVVIALLPIVSYPFVTEAWRARMATMLNVSEESSALGRVVVWRWTLDYANEHPVMGGGFNSYLANAGKLIAYSRGNEITIDQAEGKAFHNILVQMLGEHGYVGLLLYMALIAHALWNSHRLSKTCPEPWQRALARCVFISTMVYCVGGMFIGIAFYPWLFYMYGLTIAMRKSSAVDTSEELATPAALPASWTHEYAHAIVPRDRRALGN